MIFIVLLLVSLFQGVFCAPLETQGTGCFAMNHNPVISECRSLMDAFYDRATAGSITVDGNHTLQITKGNCKGTLKNKTSSKFTANADTLKVIMTNYIFNPCVLHEQWGFFETDEYSVQMEYSTAGDPKEGGVPAIQGE